MKKRPYSRPNRFGQELQKLLGEIFTRELDMSSVGFTTITDVEMTNDLKIAKVFVSVLNENLDGELVEKFFNLRAKYIRGLVGNQLSTKSVPELKFYYDNSEEEAEKIEMLLSKLNSNKIVE